MLPIVALVGRPNVGKSTLFNRLTGSGRALVADLPGVTRDRRYGLLRDGARACVLIDTGGVAPAGDGFARALQRQTEQAIGEADRLVLVVDAREGCVAADRELHARLRRVGKPVAVAVNKVDGAVRNLTFTQNEIQGNLTSTREDLLSSKSSLAVDISLLTTQANSTDIHIKDLTTTLGKVRDALHQNLSHVRDELFVEISSIVFNISQLNTHADTTDVQLRNFTFVQSEVQHDLVTTREDFLASKLALEEHISQLNAWANDTELHLRNNTFTLGELQNIVEQIQILADKHSRRLNNSNVRITELEFEVNSAFPVSPLYPFLLLSISFFATFV